ncbi:MAG TPA: amidohydrolase [Candidatus Sumerlaeota bacterium]|nr:MAG: N-substituted formamide deformylase precursor [candidate division BRC1 bacterium ADurb.Bin183]HOE62997.1 amidohydrolase [Candidatus Sumerlaeota bacterium]HRR30176.1 amidohydrolase [Candidatus Sumerlaeia bacterium]HON49574.1 amidohydrolase [Candidatus Sumerlaeota bacterium]HOR64726.1 amidohydrolase [Candidatus Sumerlaeota bacterium]
MKLYENARILTLNKVQPEARAMLCHRGVVIQLFNEPNPIITGLGALRRVNCGNRVMLPAFTDAHLHLMDTGINLGTVDVSSARNESQAVRMLKEARSNAPAGEWIQGSRWGHNLWDPPALPTKKSLDELFPENPVFLFSKCEHLLWANSLALKMAGIAAQTPDPKAGEIERDPKTGEPTGILKEDAADLICAVIPEIPAYRKKELLKKTGAHLNRFGIVNVHAADNADVFGLLQEIKNDPDFHLNVLFYFPVAKLDDLIKAKMHSGLGDARLRFGGVKLFVDGSLGGRTAWMDEPYDDEPNNFGIMMRDKPELFDLVDRSNKAGIATMTHAIGDRAVRTILEVYAEASDPPPGTWNRVEHFQLLSEKILPLLKKSKTVSSVQPVHIFSDWSAANRFWGGRARWAYAFRTMKEAGMPIIFGSDSPVEPVNPFWGIYAAMERKDGAGNPADGWFTQERLSLHEALEAFISEPPVIAGEGYIKGTLSPGARVDFVLVEENPFAVSPEALRDMKISATVAGGKTVFGEI